MGALYLKDKTVLITGGTGSLGQELVRKLLDESVRKIIVFSRDEHKQIEMERKFKEKKVRFILGDIRDLPTLHRACRDIDILLHVAALKHVSKSEYNPFEFVKTNIQGTQNVIDAAIECEVEKVLSISSDKAVNPTNLYGATKLCADKLIVNARSYAGASGTKFSVIRFGNFWGSRGSVVPLFQRLKEEDAEYIPINDFRMTRYFLTFNEACNKIIEALGIMGGGEIFCPVMPSVRITDVAKVICPNIPMREVGRISGEKLHEYLIADEDIQNTRELNGFLTIYPENTGSGNKLPEGFSCRSNKNDRWLDVESLRGMI